MVITVKEILLSKGELSILQSILPLWRSWAYRAFYPSQHTKRSSARSPSWFKVNYDGSVQGDKVIASFVVRNDIGVLIGAGSIFVASMSVSLCVSTRN